MSTEQKTELALSKNIQQRERNEFRIHRSENKHKLKHMKIKLSSLCRFLPKINSPLCVKKKFRTLKTESVSFFRKL